MYSCLWAYVGCWLECWVGMEFVVRNWFMTLIVITTSGCKKWFTTEQPVRYRGYRASKTCVHFHNAVLFLQSIFFRGTKCYILVLWIQFWYFPTYKSIWLNIWTLAVCFNFSWTLNVNWQKRNDWVKHNKWSKKNENNIFLNWHTRLRSLREAILLD